MMQKERLEWIDLAKGICMLLVVAGHLFWGPGNTVFPEQMWLDNCMTTFRMPLYFVLCGIFFKTYGSFFEFLRRKTNNLLIPFVVFLVVGRLIHIMSGVWFLGCLFFINILGYGLMAFVRKCLPTKVRLLLSSNSWILIPTFILFSLCCGWVGQYCHVDQWIHVPKLLSDQLAYLGTSIVALPFFMMGYLLRTQTRFISNRTAETAATSSVAVTNQSGDAIHAESNKAVHTESNKAIHTEGFNMVWSVLGVLACLSIPAVLGWIYHWPVSLFVFNEYEMSMPIVYLCGMAGTMGMLLLARMVVRVPVVSYIGRYSIIVLITQTYLIYLANSAERHFLGTHLDVLYWCIAFVAVLLLEIPVIWFCKRYLPYIFAQKRVF